MPFDYGLRLDNRQRIANARAKPIEANKNQSVDGAEGLFLRSGSPQNVYLLPQQSASSAARDRIRSTTIQTMSLTRSLITQQHRPILDQLLVRLGLRQGQVRSARFAQRGQYWHQQASLGRTSAVISCLLSKRGKPMLESLYWPLAKDATSASTSF
jgi:hypothetical protein